MSWPNVKLAQCIESATSGFASGDVDPEGVAQLRMNNVGLDGSLRFEKIRRIPREDSKVSRFCLEEGDVLFNATNSPNLVGKTALVRGLPEPFVFSNHFIRIRVIEDKLDAGFLAKWLTAQQQVGRFELMCNKWVNQASVRREDLLKLEVPLPPLAEQRRIAAILDKADALRAKRREAIAKLDQLLQSVFLDMFGDPVTNPKGWTLRTLGDVCDVRDGTHDSPKYVDSGYPLVTSKNVSSGKVILDGAALISESDYQQINKRSKVHRGDLLMPMIGTVGNPVLVDHEPNYAVKNVAIMKFGDNEAMGVYVLHLLRSHYFDWVTSQKNRGGTQKFLALGDIRGMKIPVPSDVCLDRFEQIARVIRDQRVQHDSAASEASRLFSSIQTEIFSGKMAIRNV